jgi:hypothetical protein
LVPRQLVRVDADLPGELDSAPFAGKGVEPLVALARLRLCPAEDER